MALEDPKQGDPANNKENITPGMTAYRSVPWWRRYRPELVKVVSLIEVKLLQAKLFPKTHKSPEVHETLNKICAARPYWCKNLNTAHEVNHELNQLLPLIATDEYLDVNLEYELKKKEDPEHRVLITELFEETEITQLLNRLRRRSKAQYLCGAKQLLKLYEARSASKAQGRHESKTPDRRWAEQLLKRLYEVRDEGWTYERALMKLKRYYLMFHAFVVGILLPLLGAVIVVASGSVGRPSNQILLVTLAGALGSTLAAMLKLRDAVVRLNDLLAVVVVAVVQALIGASLGLVAWLLLTSGAVQIGGDSIAGWELYALVAFASGFSEPFSLGLIARFIGTG
jgi:hypothetical protein